MATAATFAHLGQTGDLFLATSAIQRAWAEGRFRRGMEPEAIGVSTPQHYRLTWDETPSGAPSFTWDPGWWERYKRPILAAAIPIGAVAVVGALSGAAASSGSVTTVGGATAVAPPSVAAGAAPAVPAVASSPGLPAILKVAAVGPGIIGQVKTAIAGTPVGDYGDPVSDGAIPVFRSGTTANWTLLAMLAAGAIVVAIWGNR